METIEELLRDANSRFGAVDLRQQFEARLHVVGITQHQTQQLLEIENKALHVILDGSAKRIDYANALKLARFLRLNDNEFASLYTRQNETVKEDVDRVQMKTWLLDTFDLKGLKQGHVLAGKTSPEDVATRLREFFGLGETEGFDMGLLRPSSRRPSAAPATKCATFGCARRTPIWWGCRTPTLTSGDNC